MNIILTSGPSFLKKTNREIKAIKLENKQLIEQLKRCVQKYDNLLFVCSSPDDYEKNEKFAQTIEKSLSLSGIKFNYSDLLDSRNWLFTRSLVKNSDLVILLGGDPIEQMEFFNNIDMKEKIKGFNGCLMGISAGSVNLAKYVYCSEDESIEKTVRYRGLGLTEINIEPHFNVNDSNRINDILLKDSKDGDFIALPDESFIVIENNNINLYGDAFYFKDGIYEKIIDIDKIVAKKGI